MNLERVLSLVRARRSLILPLAAVAAIALVLLLSIGTSLDARLREPVQPGALVVDTDEDGIPDVLENYAYGTDPARWNSSPIAVSDGWLVRHGFNPLDARVAQHVQAVPPPSQTPAAYGPEGLMPFAQRLDEVYRYNASIDPTQWDQTGEGVATAWLMRYGLDPLAPPPFDEPLAGGRSRLTLREAYVHNADPRLEDTDGDGLTDEREVGALRTDPSRFSTSRSGVADGWLVRFGLDPRDPDVPSRDIARKGLTVGQTYEWSNRTRGLAAILVDGGLDPGLMSTRGGTIPDGWLVEHGLDPLEPGVEARIVDRAGAHPIARDLPEASAPPGSCVAAVADARNRTVPDCERKVLDDYKHARPPFWDEAQHGPWWGGLDPSRIDTDGDGLPDSIEIRGWFVDVKRATGAGEKEALLVRSDPLRADSDGDGLDDEQEYEGLARVGASEVRFPTTDPLNADTDYDGLDDRFEVSWGPLRLGDAYRADLALDPTDADTAGNDLSDADAYAYWTERAARYARDPSYEFPYSSHDDLAWVREISDGKNARLGAAEIAALFAPHGDVAGDGVPNLLDYSSRVPALANGWAVHPETLANSPFGAAHPRSQTDPANPDTDGDALPDAWELKYGAWDAKVPGWNLDPAKWSSYHDDDSDADRDLDGDGVEWPTFSIEGASPTRAKHAYPMSNAQELKFGTDPNRRDTSGDALPDGWKAFWGIVYPSLLAVDAGAVYPGAPGGIVLPSDAPRIDPLSKNEGTLASLPYVRFSEDAALLTARNGLVVTEAVSATRRVTTGGSHDVYEIRGTAAWTLADAQRHGTNPYLLDTDGDGVPDAWEALHALDPLDAADAASDADGDGLTALQEFWGRTPRRDLNAGPLAILATLSTASDPALADTDLGGLPDGLELLSGLDPLAPLDDAAGGQALDSDCDGVSDFSEVLGHLAGTGGARVTTDPLDPDTDRDGLIDGPNRALSTGDAKQATCLQDLRARGVLLQPLDDAGTQWRAHGEADAGTDATLAQTASSGVPDGWIAWAQRIGSRSLGADELRNAYKAGRPGWWAEAEHGPWWWGRAPTQPATVTDRDCNGLDDDGEDPFGGANPGGVHRSGNATSWDLEAFGEHVAEGAAPLDALRRAQSLAQRSWTPRDCSTVPIAPRATVRLELGAFDGTPLADLGPNATLRKGDNHTLTGRLLSNSSDPAAPNVELNGQIGIGSVTVLVSVNDLTNVVGVAVTDELGRFNASISLVKERPFPIPTEGITILGRAQGEATLAADPAAVEPGTHTKASRNRLIVWTYATPPAPPDDHPQRQDLRVWTGQGIATASGVGRAPAVGFNLTVAADSLFEWDVEEPAFVGERFNVTLRLLDRAGSPVPNRAVLLIHDGEGFRNLTTDAKGEATLQLAPTRPSPTLIARFAGGDFISASESRIVVALKNRVSFVSVSVFPETQEPGQNVTVFGTLASGGRPASGVGVRLPQLGLAESPTDAKGSFAIRVPIPANAPPGAFALPIVTNGSGAYASATAETSVLVLDATRLILKAPALAEAGDVVRAEGSLLGAGSRPVRGALVELSVAGARVGHATTQRDGSFAANVSLSEPGIVLLKAAYAGDGAQQQAAAQETARVLVRSQTRLDVDLGTLTKGGELVVQGRLVDALGRGLASARVYGTLDGRERLDALTRTDGTFAWRAPIPAERASSVLTLHARYDGTQNGVHQPVATTIVSPVLTRLAIEWDGLAVRHGENAIAGRVVALGNTPLDVFRGTLRTPLGELPLTTRPDGRFVLDLDVPDTLYVAALDAEIIVPGTPLFAQLREPLALPLAVGTRLALVEAGDWTLGEPAHVSGTLVDEHGRPVRGGDVRVSLAGRELATVAVSSGGFSWSDRLPADIPTGAATLELVARTPAPYEGDTLDVPVHARAPVRLAAESRHLVSLAKTDSVAFTLRSADDEPLVNAVVLVRDSDAAVPYAVWTDARGRGEAPLSPGVAKVRSVTLEFAGTDTLSAASVATQVVLEPPAARLAWWIWAAALVVAGAIALVVWRRRSKRAEVAREAIALAEARLVAGDEFRATIFHLFRMLTQLAKEAGAAPSDSDTPREVALKLRRVLPVSRPALRQLVMLFEAARYDDAAVGASHREDALSCFHVIRSEMKR